MTDSYERYHKGSILLHWIIAVVLIANLVLGLMLEDIADADKFMAYQMHKSLGITVLALSLLRLGWRFAFKAPAYPSSFAGWEVFVAKVTHLLFYGLMIGIPLSGWLLVSASPRNIPTVLFGVLPLPHIPGLQGFADQKMVAHQIGEMHELLANAIIVLLVLHVLAALRHHFMLKDGIMFRMAPPWASAFLARLRGQR